MTDPATGGHRRPWHIVTGEYPPVPGGVSDFTEQIVARLTRAGDPVTVWTVGEGDRVDPHGARVRGWEGGWSPAGLARLGALLDAEPGPRRLFVQHTPNSWGYKGANLRFGPWLAGRRGRGDDVWVMVHEAMYPWLLREKPTRWALAAIHRVMIRQVLAGSDRVFTASPMLAEHFRPYLGRRNPPVVPLPVSSHFPTLEGLDPAAIAERRRELAPEGGELAGHFGTFGAPTLPGLRAALPAFLEARPSARFALIGRGGREFLEAFRAEHPALADRVVATGGLDADRAAQSIAACDLMIQPFIDGVSNRRSTIMACLGLGRPTVANAGRNTDPHWASCPAIDLAPRDAEIAPRAARLMADPAAREALGAAALRLYREQFSAERAERTLLEQADAADADAVGPNPVKTT